jgi:hypothetical protein
MKSLTKKGVKYNKTLKNIFWSNDENKKEYECKFYQNLTKR